MLPQKSTLHHPLYSEVSNKRGGRNKRRGWTNGPKLIKGGDGIKGGGGWTNGRISMKFTAKNGGFGFLTWMHVIHRISVETHECDIFPER